jgi:hypothetical protein
MDNNTNINNSPFMYPSNNNNAGIPTPVNSVPPPPPHNPSDNSNDQGTPRGGSTKRALLGVLFIAVAIIATPVALSQIQKFQDVRQRADTITTQWVVGQSASTVCSATGDAVITVSFSNLEPSGNSFAMKIVATDQQTGVSVNMGTINPGQTVSKDIHTGKTTLSSGSVVFKMTWADGHSGTDSRTATYKGVSYCTPPTPTVTPTPKPTVGPYTPTPTACPTLGPVQNVHIDCPNCPS